MPLETAGPLNRLVTVDRLPPDGTEFTVQADAAEREALARDFGLLGIASLVGRYRVTGSVDRVRVSGVVEATIAQTCVVTLEPFDATLREEVDVDFESAELARRAAPRGEDDPAYEPPDEIVNGQIDLGALTAEFLSLGLDPYPRKPGTAEFAYREGDPAKDSPFAKLGRLKGDA